MRKRRAGRRRGGKKERPRHTKLKEAIDPLLELGTRLDLAGLDALEGR
jgi:hypothetical protein